jgi:hypothetical protein
VERELGVVVARDHVEAANVGLPPDAGVGVGLTGSPQGEQSAGDRTPWRGKSGPLHAEQCARRLGDLHLDCAAEDHCRRRRCGWC